MTLAEANAVLDDTIRATYEIFDACDHVRSDRLPSGVSLMVLSDTIARIEVDLATVATVEGARVGDSEASVLARYQGRIRVEPHPYDPLEGSYLIVETPGDTLHQLVFESIGGLITTYRVGLRPAVEFIEGCA
jgi:hypothetical protein